MNGVASAPGAMTGAVAHRLGVELARLPASGGSWPSDHIRRRRIHRKFRRTFSYTGSIGSELIELYTVAAQLRLFTSREPDIDAMREVLGS